MAEEIQNDSVDAIIQITNKQLITWLLLATAIGLTFLSMQLSWLNVELEMKEIQDEGRDDRIVVVNDYLNERNWRITTYYQYNNDSEIDYNVNVYTLSNNELLSEYEGTVDDKNRTWSMLLLTGIISLIAAGLVISKAFVAYESQHLPLFPLFIAGLLAITTCAQFMFTYEPFDGTEGEVDNIPDDEGDCLSESSKGIPFIYEVYEGNQCKYGSTEVNIKGESGVGIGFYLASISGIMMLLSYFSFLRDAGIRFISVVNTDSNEVKMDAKTFDTIENKGDTSQMETDFFGQKPRSHAKFLTYIISIILGVAVFMYNAPALLDLINSLDDDYNASDLNAEATYGSNDWLIQITFANGPYQEIDILVTDSNGNGYWCEQTSGYEDLPDAWPCGFVASTPEDDPLDGWQKGESFNIFENGENICDPDMTTIQLKIIADGTELYGVKEVICN